MEEDKNKKNKKVEVLPAEKRKKANASREVVSYNPLTAYLREIRELPRISVEEERELAIRYLKENDLQAAYQLVSSNLWLVVKIARKYDKLAKSIMDLIQEGNIGLMEAVKRFDPSREVRLPTYATWWIKAYIIRYILANWRLVKIGTTQAQKKLFFNLNKEKAKLEREGFDFSPKLIANRLNVKESEVIEMEQRLSSPDVSVDAPLSGDSDSTWLSILPTSSPNSEELYADQEMTNLLSQAIKTFKTTLNDRYLLVFERRVISQEKQTLQQ